MAQKMPFSCDTVGATDWARTLALCVTTTAASFHLRRCLGLLVCRMMGHAYASTWKRSMDGGAIHSWMCWWFAVLDDHLLAGHALAGAEGPAVGQIDEFHLWAGRYKSILRSNSMDWFDEIKADEKEGPMLKKKKKFKFTYKILGYGG